MDFDPQHPGHFKTSHGLTSQGPDGKGRYAFGIHEDKLKVGRYDIADKGWKDPTLMKPLNTQE
jgi:hypothetical protein